MVYATAKAFFSIPMAGVRLATSIGRMTANVASAMVYGTPPPAPASRSSPTTRLSQQRFEHDEDASDVDQSIEDEQAMLLQ